MKYLKIIPSIAILLSFTIVIILALADVTHTTPILNSTYGYNTTNENLTLYANISGISINNITDFRRGASSIAVLNMPFEAQHVPINDTSIVLAFFGENQNPIVSNNTLVGDASQFNSNGTISGGVFFNQSLGRIGAAYNFNGSGSISIPYVQRFNLTGNVSVETWIKYSSSLTNTPLVSHWASDNKANFILQIYYLSSDYLAFVVKQGGVNKEAIASAVKYNDSLWHHVVGTYNGTAVAIYVDGALNAATAASGVLNDTDSNIGIGKYGDPTGGNQFNGAMDEVIIYNRSLTAAEVSSHYALGSKVLDYSTYGNNGTLDTTGSTNPYFNATGGKIGGAYQFDGINDVINITTTSSLNVSQNFTISAWVKLASLSGRQDIIAKWDSTGNKQHYLLTWNPSGFSNKFVVYRNGYACTLSGTPAASTSAISANTWYHLVGTSNATNLTLYVNGVMEGVAPLPGNVSCDNTLVHIGGNPTEASNQYFNGTIDEVMIYNMSLTPNQVNSIYQIGNASKPPQVHSSMAIIGQNWSACVTPTNGFWNGNTLCSNTVNFSGASLVSIYYANITPSPAFRSSSLDCIFKANSTTPSDAMNANVTWLNGTTAVPWVNVSFLSYAQPFFTQNSLMNTSLTQGSVPSNITRKGEVWKCNITVENTNTHLVYNQLSDAVTILNSPPAILNQTLILNFTTLDKFNVTVLAIDNDDTTDILNCSIYSRNPPSTIWSRKNAIFSNLTGECIGEINTTTTNATAWYNYTRNELIESFIQFFDASGIDVNSSRRNTTLPMATIRVNTNATSLTALGFGTIFNISANITGNNTIVARFRFVAPDGTEASDSNTTITNSTDIYVSPNVNLNQGGIWQINVSGYNAFSSDTSTFNISVVEFAVRIKNFSVIPTSVDYTRDINGTDLLGNNVSYKFGKLCGPSIREFNNVTLRAEVTSDANLYKIISVNFTVRGTNHSFAIANINGTNHNNTWWNSSSVILFNQPWWSVNFNYSNATTWQFNVTAYTNESNMSTSSIATETLIVQSCKASSPDHPVVFSTVYPYSLFRTITPGENISTVFIVGHTSTENVTMNLTPVMYNSTFFDISLNQSGDSYSFPRTCKSISCQMWRELYINVSIRTINSSLPDGRYDGNITINLTKVIATGATIANSTGQFPIISIFVVTNHGNIDMLNATTLAKCSGSNCDYTNSVSGVEPFSYRWTVNNSGNFSLTECRTNISGSLENISHTFNIDDFSLNIGQQRNITLTFLSRPAGDWTGYVDVTCNSTANGYKDSVSAESFNAPYLTFSFTDVNGTGGGVGAGGQPKIVEIQKNITPTKEMIIEALSASCGNGVCDTGPPSYEDFVSCHKDCPFKLSAKQFLCLPTANNPECIWRRSWSVTLILIGGLLSLIFLIVASYREKKKKKKMKLQP